MRKYSSLILLVAVAVFWSDADAVPRPRNTPWDKRGLAVAGHQYKRWSPRKRSTDKVWWKRETENDENSTESPEEVAKQQLVTLLWLNGGTLNQSRTLLEKFREALDREWDSYDDFSKYVGGVYEKVTGWKVSELLANHES